MPTALDSARPAPGSVRLQPQKYLDLAHRLLDEISREGLGPGDRLGTEEEIGEKHGASRFTVRHALSMLAREGYISRKKALGTFVEMVPDHAPRAGIVRGTVTVACSNEQASHMDEDLAFATVLRSIERTLADHGFIVQILGLGQDRRSDSARLNHLVTGQDLKGMIAIGPCLEPYRDALGGLPTVFTGYFYSTLRPHVGDDVREVCRESISHLIEQGHRDIAVLCGPRLDPHGFGLFVEGYRKACERTALPFRRGALHHAYPGEDLVEFATCVLNNSPGPTAVLAEDWRVCDAVFEAAANLGLSVPRDLSVVGYGQNVLHMNAPVAVTAYVPDSDGIGRRAAEVLINVLQGNPAPAAPVVLSGKLIVRSSVRTLRPGQTEIAS